MYRKCRTCVIVKKLESDTMIAEIVRKEIRSSWNCRTCVIVKKPESDTMIAEIARKEIRSLWNCR